MTKEQALPGILILAPGERITADIVNYIQYAKEKGCSLTGPQDMEIARLNVVKKQGRWVCVLGKSEFRGEQMNDIITEHRNKIMDILDKFYEILKVYNKRWIQVFVEEEIPNKFLTGEIEEENWKGTILKFKTWKYIPSDITENEILELENTIGTKLPIPLKAYYTSYFHLFDWQRNFSQNSPEHRMEGIWTAYNKYMISFGYLPFSWDTENGCLFCIKFDADNNVYVLK